MIYKQSLADLSDTFLQDYIDAHFTPSPRAGRGFYNCPFCGSGEGKNGTGAFKIYQGQDGRTRGRCNKCNEGGDLCDLHRKINHLTNREAERQIREMYGRNEAPAPTQQMQLEQQPAKCDFSQQVSAWEAALWSNAGHDALEYLRGRGFTDETIKRFKLGYWAYRNEITFPYSGDCAYYAGRRLRSEDIEQYHGKYDKPKASEAGQEPLFNPDALYASSVCFVVESQLCAISIEQAGGAAVAIGGQGEMKLLNKIKKQPTSAVLALCLDNDDTGRKGTERLASALDKVGATCADVSTLVMGEQSDENAPDFRKDPNEILSKDGTQALQAAIETAQESIKEAKVAEEEERAERTGAAMVDSFLQAVQSRRYEPMPTGIADIDRAIGGGFIRQQLILLGAAPGAGKTALSQWLFEGMASRGTPCLYLNLEMSREQMLARSLARISAAQGNRIRTTDILQGYQWTDEQRAAIITAADTYKRDIAPRMVYNPDGLTADLDAIVYAMETEAKRAQNAGQPAPCVVLDYLQIVTGTPGEDAAHVIQRAVMALKDFAIKYNTIVFVVIAHNRAANSSGDVSMEAGRDTSALEYSADLQFGLAFTRCLKRDGQIQKKREELTEEDRKLITLKVTKGRFGGMGKEVDLRFDGETMTYTQIASEFTPTNASTPFDNATMKTPTKKQLSF